MEAHFGTSISQRTSRNQKYLHFRLLPGDEALIEQLSPGQRAILKSDGSYVKRAEDLGIAIGTVRSRLHRAREALSQLRALRDGANTDGGSELH
jgi:hypothetical protein